MKNKITNFEKTKKDAASVVSIIFAVFAVIAIALISANSAAAQSCAVSPSFNDRLMPDSDCDGIIDALDNCPFIVNPVQQDSDRNGLGDACDVFIESVRTNPGDYVFTGRAFSTFVTINNNREFSIRNLRLRVFSPELGIESVQYIDNIDSGCSKIAEFTLRAPLCSPPGEFGLVVEASFMNEIGQWETIPAMTSIQVVPDQNCVATLNGGQNIGKSFVDVMEIQDVYKGHEAVFPMKISNRESENKEYIISVTGLDGWGSSRLSPGSLIIVPKGAERTVDLYVSAKSNIPSGERTFVVTMKTGEEVQRFLLRANVKESGEMDNTFIWIFAFKILLIFVVLVLLLIAIIIGVRKYIWGIKKESPTNSYY